MALDLISSIINEKRDAAAIARNTFKQQSERIRADDTRTGMGKKSLLAAALRDTQLKIKQLQEEELQAVNEKRASLERQVFGIAMTDPASIMAYRDAQARVEPLGIDDHDKAQDMLHGAALSNDHTLASALLSKAIDQGWTDITEGYKAQHPDQGAVLTDLLDLDAWNKRDSESLSGRFGDYFIATPRELSGERESEINRLANANGAAAVVTGGGHVWGVN